jgi:hypothetical protein
MKVSLAEVIAVLFVRTPRAIKNRIADRKLRKLLKTAKTYALRDLPEDTFGRVTGLVRPLDKRLIEAPLSGRLCVYFDISIEPQLGKGTTLRELATESDAIPFLLEADGYRVVIDPAHAQISAAFDHVVSSAEPTDRSRALLARYRWEGGEVFCREAILEADEAITVVGAAIREPDPDAPRGEGYRDAAPTRLRMTGSKRFPLLVSDDPRSL